MTQIIWMDIWMGWVATGRRWMSWIKHDLFMNGMVQMEWINCHPFLPRRDVCGLPSDQLGKRHFGLLQVHPSILLPPVWTHRHQPSSDIKPDRHRSSPDIRPQRHRPSHLLASSDYVITSGSSLQRDVITLCYVITSSSSLQREPSFVKLKDKKSW